MLFSEYFNIKCLGDEDWFNPILTQDTLLFIDPFAVLNQKMNCLKILILK